MYYKFDACLHDFSFARHPGDYWYDCAILEASDILKEFDESDWGLLLRKIRLKPLFWQKRFIECLGDIHSPYDLDAILIVIDTDDKDVFLDCADSLRLLKLSELSEYRKEQLLTKISLLLGTSSPPERKILEAFVNRLNHSER